MLPEAPEGGEPASVLAIGKKRPTCCPSSGTGFLILIRQLDANACLWGGSVLNVVCRLERSDVSNVCVCRE